MPLLRHLLRPALAWTGLVIALCAGLVPAAGWSEDRDSTSLRITLDEARQAAAFALSAGRTQDALSLADGVLMGAPEDMPALFIKARALRDLGREAAAVAAARQAWDAAAGDRERYFAAMMMAQTRSSGGQNGLAQFWLRRAAQVAPEDTLRDLAVADFRHVRRITPWRAAFDFYVQPSDNLNDAPYEDTVLPFGTLRMEPLDGMRIGGSGRLRYILPLNAKSRMHVMGFAAASKVRLSDKAQDVPGAEAEDYANSMLGGAVSVERLGQDGNSLSRADLSLARHWQAGDPVAHVARLDLSHDMGLAPGLTFGARVGLEGTARLDSDSGDAQTRELGFRLAKRFETGVLSLDLTTGETFSEASTLDRRTREVGLSYSLAKPVAGMKPRVGLGYSEFDYDAPGAFSLTGDAREDSRWTLDIDVLLPDLDYYGFAPEVGVSFTDRNSNYNLYKSRSTDLRLGLKSVF